MDDLRLATDDGDDPFKPEEADFKITCARCERDISECICAADWLGYRALWVAATRELEKHKRIKLDVDKAKADFQEFFDAAMKDAEKFNKTIESLQRALGNAISTLQLYTPSPLDAPEVKAQIAHYQDVLEASRAK